MVFACCHFMFSTILEQPRRQRQPDHPGIVRRRGPRRFRDQPTWTSERDRSGHGEGKLPIDLWRSAVPHLAQPSHCFGQPKASSTRLRLLGKPRSWDSGCAAVDRRRRVVPDANAIQRFDITVADGH